MAGSKDKVMCLKCDTLVQENHKSLQCHMCEHWLHLKCTGISDILFKELDKQFVKDGCHWWPCNSCKSSATKLNRMVQLIGNKLEKVEEKVDENTAKVDNVTTKVVDLSKRVENLEENGPDLTQSADLVFKEMKDRDSRLNNLIIHKVPEPPAELRTAKDRKEHDRKKVAAVFKHINPDHVDSDIKFMARLGEGSGDLTSPRPVIVGFHAIAKREFILGNARRLADSAFQNYSLIPDLTARQRKEEDDLRKEADKLNSDMSQEESLNWMWKLVGQRGKRKLIKSRIKDQDQGLNMNSDHQQAGTSGYMANRRRQKRNIQFRQDVEGEVMEVNGSSPKRSSVST